jgi:hypothetical protein
LVINTCFGLRNVDKKMITSSARPPTKRYLRGLPEEGYAPFYLGVWKGAAVPLIAKEIFDL